MSSVSPMRSRTAENPRFPPQCKSTEGESVLRVFRYRRGNPMDKSLIFDYKRECVYTQGLTKVEAVWSPLATLNHEVVLIGKPVKMFNSVIMRRFVARQIFMLSFSLQEKVREECFLLPYRKPTQVG